MMKKNFVWLSCILLFQVKSEGFSMDDVVDVVFHPNKVSFPDAVDMCRRNGRIANITSSIELHALVSEIMQKKGIELPSPEKIWTSAACGENGEGGTPLLLALNFIGKAENGTQSWVNYTSEWIEGNPNELNSFACKLEISSAGECLLESFCNETSSITDFGKTKCACESGYKYEEGFCQDIDECSLGDLHPCNVSTTCINNNGSYSCVPEVLPSGDDSCKGKCEEVAIDGFEFPSTNRIGAVISSKQNCSTGTRSASLRCTSKLTESGSEIFRKCMYDTTSFASASCYTRLEDFFDIADNITEETIEQTLQDLQLTVSNNLTDYRTESVANIFVNITKAVIEKAIPVTPNMAANIVEVASKVNQKLVESLYTNAAEERENTEKIVEAMENFVAQIPFKGENISLGSEKIYLTVSGIEATSDVQETPAMFIAKSFSETSEQLESNFALTLPPNVVGKAFEELENSKSYSKAKRSDETPKKIYLTVTMVVFDNAAFFPSNDTINEVISLTVGQNITLRNLSTPFSIDFLKENSSYGEVDGSRHNSFSVVSKVQFQNRRCSFWDYNTGKWSEEGCCLILREDKTPTCKCNHTTNFAMLVNVETISDNIALNIFSNVACAVSLVFLAITVILLLLNKQMRTRISTQIQLHIFSCLFVGYLVFLVGVDLKESVSHQICFIITAIIHYAFLACFLWMAIYSSNIYYSLIKIFHAQSETYLRKCSTFAYGVSFLVVGINIALTAGYFDNNINESKTRPRFCEEVLSQGDNGSEHQYAPMGEIYGQKHSYYVADTMCWINTPSIYFSFLLIIGLVILNNFIVVVVVSKKVLFKQIQDIRSTATKKSKVGQLAVVVSLSITLGLTWGVGYALLITPDETFQIAFGWIFTLLNGFQGIVVFYLTCVRRRDMFHFWYLPLRNILLGKKKDTAVTLSLNVDLSSKTATTSGGYLKATSSEYGSQSVL